MFAFTVAKFHPKDTFFHDSRAGPRRSHLLYVGMSAAPEVSLRTSTQNARLMAVQHFRAESLLLSVFNR